MAYGDSGSKADGLSNASVTFKGFSSRADKRNFKLYDFEVAKQDMINRLSVRKGERVENPEFGTIIYDAIFEPFTIGLVSSISIKPPGPPVTLIPTCPASGTNHFGPHPFLAFCELRCTSDPARSMLPPAPCNCVPSEKDEITVPA